MTPDAALAFLNAHQPLPPDEELSDELIGEFDQVIQFLEHNPDPRAIRPLLFSFGDGSGFGVYQVVEGVVTQFPPEQVLPALHDALRHPNYGIRYWCLQIAQSFPDDSLMPLAVANLPDEHPDIRNAAAYLLAAIGNLSAIPILEAAFAKEESDGVRDAMADALAELRGSSAEQ
jgi:hypothetical protein